MKPLLHANLSAKAHGGKPEDYLEIHDFFDSTKICMPDFRHRALLHNAFGPFLAERVFGTFITNSDGKRVSVRDIAEEHIIQDLGFIPTVEQYLNNMVAVDWMSGSRKRKGGKRTGYEPLED